MARALRVYEIGIIKTYQYCIITNTNMFHVGRFRLFHAGRRALRRERVFRDRTKPLDIYDDFRVNRQIQI